MQNLYLKITRWWQSVCSHWSFAFIFIETACIR